MTNVDETPLLRDDGIFATVTNVPLELSGATLLQNDQDPEGTALAIAAVGNAVNGSVALASGQVVFTPDAGFAGNASFTYTGVDGTGALATATVSLIVQSTSINGTSGSETLLGTAFGDAITGRGGNDVLKGGNGADTYVYNILWYAGDGFDVVRDSGTDNALDTIQISSSYHPDGPGAVWQSWVTGSPAVRIAQADQGRDLVVNFIYWLGEGHAPVGTVGSITLDDRIVDANAGADLVRFGDGTTFTYEQLFDLSLSTYASAIGGDARANTFDTQNAPLYQGRNGADTYVYNRFYGQKTIADAGTDLAVDVLQLGAGFTQANTHVSKSADGRDIILTLNGPYPTERGMPTGQDRIVLGSEVSSPNQGIEEVRFADGTVWDRNKLLSLASLPGPGDDAIYGDGQANTLYGLAGFDWLQGNGGADAYLFNRGDGIDTIFDNGPSSEIDTVQLGYGIGAADVAVTQGRNARDIVLSVVGTADQLILRDRLVTGSGGADQIRFWDGTVWTYATLVQKLGTGGAGNDLLFGDPGSGTLAGGAGGTTVSTAPRETTPTSTMWATATTGSMRTAITSAWPIGWSSAPA